MARSNTRISSGNDPPPACRPAAAFQQARALDQLGVVDALDLAMAIAQRQQGQGQTASQHQGQVWGRGCGCGWRSWLTLQQIAHPAHGADQPAVELLAQVVDEHFQGVARGGFLPAIEGIAQALAGDDGARPATAAGAAAGIPWASPPPRRRGSAPPGWRVEADAGVLQQWLRAATAAADQGAQARLEFVQVAGLDR